MKFGLPVVLGLVAFLPTSHGQFEIESYLPALRGQQPLLQRRLQGGIWSPLGSEVYGGTQANEQFGRQRDISRDGTTIVGCSTVTGRCKVYVYNGSDYVQKGATINQPTTGESFGETVRISADGKRLAVGAHLASSPGFTDNGCAYVYDFIGSAWQLTASLWGDSTNARIGTGLAMSGDGKTIAASYSNRVEISKEVNGVWGKQALTGAGGSIIDLNAGGDMLAIGWWEINGASGMVLTFRYDGSSWATSGNIGTPYGGYFGRHLAIATVGSITTVVAGSTNVNGGQGMVSVYENNGGSSWTLLQHIDGTRPGERFGDKIDLSEDGTTFVASAMNLSPFYARVYRKSGSTFSQLGGDADLTLAAALDFDVRITGDGNALLVSDVTANAVATNAGFIQVWVTGDHSISAGGDPHFYTFRNQHYDFHGHCDLVLLEASHFAQGKGLSVHIRSSAYKEIFSYISDAAIRIGDDVLEIGGGGKWLFNGQSLPSLASETIGGYKMENTKTKKGRAVYKIFLDGKQEIDIREFKNWITVYVLHPADEDFAGTVGLMGSYETGSWLSRDGQHTHHDVNEFGLDWQVHEADGLLFQTPSLHPDKCDLPIVTSLHRKRRLAESSISREAATQACAHWSPKAMEDCIMDVIISEDVGMADGGPL